jgi:beta-lactamase class A
MSLRSSGSLNSSSALMFALGITIGAAVTYVGNFNPKPGKEITNNIYPIRTNERNFTFINPLLSYELPSGITLGEYSPLSDKIKTLIQEFKSINPDTSVSVYFQNLNNGRRIGIDEDKKYTPASLMKVIVLIAYFRKARIDPTILDQDIFYKEEIQKLSHTIPYDPGTKLVLNEPYKIDDLIERMITQSDNGATYALLHEIDRNILAQVYEDLHIDAPPEEGRAFTISVSDYALLFRVLYNATYVNRALSERALELLSRTEYKDGITGSLDPEIQVAHKYGEAVTEVNGSIAHELHDCGIIYYPDKPYVLCVMTSGQNTLHLTSLVQQISKAVYQDMKNEESD